MNINRKIYFIIFLIICLYFIPMWNTSNYFYAVKPTTTTVSGAGSKCPPGQQKVGNACKPIKPVGGSTSSGSGACPPGQQKVGNACKPVKPVGGSTTSSSGAKCPPGQQKVGNACKPVKTVGGSTSSGSGACPPGQQKVGNACKPVKPVGGGAGVTVSSNGVPKPTDRKPDTIYTKPNAGGQSVGMAVSTTKATFQGSSVPVLTVGTQSVVIVNGKPVYGTVTGGTFTPLANQKTVNPVLTQLATGQGSGIGGMGTQVGVTLGQFVSASAQSGGRTTGTIPTVVAQKGIVNWAWSGLTSTDKETHDNTKPNGEQIVMVDAADPKSKIDEAKKVVGSKGLVLGYLSAGSIESWRYDDLKKQGYKGPPPDLSGTERGGSMKGWAGETWVDANKWEKMMPYMKAQMEFMKARGINGIEVDNMSIDSGKCQTKQCRDQNFAYAQALAKTAKDMGMTIFMKNGSEFGNVDKNYMPRLAQTFDGFITEQANQFSNDNNTYKPYAESGKPWYNFEYRNKGKTCTTTAGQTQTYYQTSNGWEEC